MQTTEQVVTNWGARGVSKDGALKAEELFGCSPLWILKGAQNAGAGNYSPEALTLAWLLDQIQERIAKVRANHAATEVILRELPPGVLPTRTQSEPASPEKQRA